MFRRRCLGVMIDICLGIYVQTRKHAEGPPVDTIVEILSPDHDWSSGAPRIGSKVKVNWTDGEVYTAVFQGASEEKWEVHFPNGQIHKVRRDRIFRLKQRIPPHIMKLIVHK
ncbi:hypothetical protein ACTXT7_008982 [Hymenolepis weldensis]